MLWRTLPLIALLFSSGCATDVSSLCPKPVAYSPAFQERLADEIAALPPGTAMETAILDYGRLRAAARACAP